MTYEIESMRRDEQPTAACRATLSNDAAVGAWLAEAYAEVTRFLAETGNPAAGPPYARFTFRDLEMDVEAGFPVTRPVIAGGPVVTSALPAGPVAVTTHYGPYEDLEAAYKAVSTWLDAHGYVRRGGHWEIYHDDPARQPDSSRWRTDVVAPYARSHR